MFYKIGDKYYVLVGSKYVELKFEIKGNDINAIPTENVIEKNPNVKAIEKTFNNDFKKEIIKSQKSFGEHESERGQERNRSRFDR